MAASSLARAAGAAAGGSDRSSSRQQRQRLQQQRRQLPPGTPGSGWWLLPGCTQGSRPCRCSRGRRRRTRRQCSPCRRRPRSGGSRPRTQSTCRRPSRRRSWRGRCTAGRRGWSVAQVGAGRINYDKLMVHPGEGCAQGGWAWRVACPERKAAPALFRCCALHASSSTPQAACRHRAWLGPGRRKPLLPPPPLLQHSFSGTVLSPAATAAACSPRRKACLLPASSRPCRSCTRLGVRPACKSRSPRCSARTAGCGQGQGQGQE